MSSIKQLWILLLLASSVNAGWFFGPTSAEEAFSEDEFVEYSLTRELKGGGVTLMFAALNGNTEAVQLLINAEVNLNTKNKDGMTSLMAAANNNHMDIVQMLIKAKADYQSLLPLVDGWTGYYGGTLKLPNREMYDLLTKLLIKPTIVQAVLQGKTRWMKNMIESNWNVNRKDKDGHTPLMWASAIGHTEIVKLLIEANANVNEKNKNGGTSLMNAAYHGHTEIVEILIKADAVINAITKNGATAFMRARHNNHTKILQLLRKTNTDINVKTETVRAAGKSRVGRRLTVSMLASGGV